MKVKSEGEVSQWFSTLSDSMDCSLPGSSAHGIFQARVLEWGATAFSDDKGNREYKNSCLTSNTLPVLLHYSTTPSASSHHCPQFLSIPSNPFRTKKKSCVSPSVVLDSLQSHELKLTRLFCPWNSPGRNTGVGEVK